MCKFEKNLNRVYTLSGIVMVVLVIIAMSSCGSASYQVSNCPGLAINENEVEYSYDETGYIDCENCDEID